MKLKDIEPCTARVRHSFVSPEQLSQAHFPFGNELFPPNELLSLLTSPRGCVPPKKSLLFGRGKKKVWPNAPASSHCCLTGGSWTAPNCTGDVNSCGRGPGSPTGNRRNRLHGLESTCGQSAKAADKARGLEAKPRHRLPQPWLPQMQRWSQ